MMIIHFAKAVGATSSEGFIVLIVVIYAISKRTMTRVQYSLTTWPSLTVVPLSSITQ